MCGGGSRQFRRQLHAAANWATSTALASHARNHSRTSLTASPSVARRRAASHPGPHDARRRACQRAAGRLLWLPDKVAPDISRLSPLAGLQRIFSLPGTMRLGFGLFKVLVVSIVAAAVLWRRWDDVLRASALDIGPARQIPDRYLAVDAAVGRRRARDPGDLRLRPALRGSTSRIFA